MTNESKILLEEFNSEFKKYKSHIANNSWLFDVYYDTKKNKLLSSKLDLEISIIDTIIKSTNKFKEDVGDDIDKKPIQDFIKFTSGIINSHISRLQKYKRDNPIGKYSKKSDDFDEFNKNQATEESNIEFHSDLFALITKTKVALSRLKIDETEMSKKSVDLFYGNSKAPLMMREYLSENFSVIKDKTDNLGLDFSVEHINPATSNEMLVNMKAKDIPPWDSKKHFFEQEISTIQFWEEEKNKIRNGINIGGFHISDWLYWHSNVFKMAYGAGEEKDMKVALFRDTEYFFDHMYLKAKDHGRRGVFSYGSRRIAKALKNNEKLYYSDGTIRNIGDSKVGDVIKGGDGLDTTIKGVYPQGKIKLYKLTFSDGREIECCDEHLWKVYDTSKRKYIILSLKDIKLNYFKNRISNGSEYKNGKDRIVKEYKYYIPLSKSIDYVNENTFIEPYYLGLWLGDGRKKDTSITTVDSEIIDYIREYAYSENLNFVNTRGKITYSLTKKKGKFNIIIQKLKSRNLIDNKHIPDECFKWNKEDRLQLLRGLMDTDGTVLEKGHKSFTTSSRILSENFIKLLQELGIGYRIKHRTGNYIKKDGLLNTYYHISLFTDEDIFNLSRKKTRCELNKDRINNSKKTRVAIVNIEESDEDYATCIEVNNEDNLFLTTNSIVTHNSAGMTSRLLHGLWTIKNAKGTVQGFSKIPDLEALLTYANDAIQNMFPALKIPANSITMDDGVMLGLKGKKAQDRYDFAHLAIINLEGGNTKKGGQKTAGATPDIFLLDEAGKGDCITPWKAAMPSFAGGKNGKWRLVPLLSGCVCAGTKVYNHNGEFLNIEDLKQTDGIIGFDRENQNISKEIITWMQEPSEKPCYKITTRKGHTLECSYEHPVLIRHRNKREKRNEKWVRKIEFVSTENLKVGQQLLIAESINIWGTKKMWEPRLVGWFIGDGSYGHNEVPSISSCDYEINEYISDNFETSNKKNPEITKEGKHFLQRRLKGTGKNLRELGIFGQTKCNKTLPLDLYKYSKKDLTEMLGGLFDTDGHVTLTGSKPQVCFTSGCENLVLEIRDLLNKFGIHPTYNKVDYKPNSLVKRSGHYYVLSIGDKRSVETFYREIGFKIKYKKENLEKAVKIFSKYKEGIPKELRNVRLDSIKSVEYIGMKPIYNLTASNTNTYLANNIITHNTAGEGELSVDAELMLKNPDAYNILQMDWDFLESFIDPDYVTWKRNTFGFFVPAQLSLDAPDKIITPFSDFIGQPDNEKLSEVDIYVTDWKASKEFFEEKRRLVSSDLDLLSGEINSFPLDPEDCYITSEINMFPGMESKNRRKFVEENGLGGQAYRFWKDANNVIHADITTDPIILEYPYKGGNFDAPVMLTENPLLSDTVPPLGLYVIGFDDAKQDKSDGDSVLSATFFKRSFEGGEWANRFVGSYASRPERKRDYYKTLHLVMKALNARLLHENEDNGFVEFLEENHSDDLFTHVSTGIGLASEENLNQNKNRRWGWSPTPNNIYHAEQKLVRYSKSENNVVGDQEGLSGIDLINDTMLLQEMYKYKKKANADRIRSASLALTLAQYYDRSYQYMKYRRNRGENDEVFKKKVAERKSSRGLTDIKGLKQW